MKQQIVAGRQWLRGHRPNAESEIVNGRPLSAPFRTVRRMEARAEVGLQAPDGAAALLDAANCCAAEMRCASRLHSKEFTMRLPFVDRAASNASSTLRCRKKERKRRLKSAELRRPACEFGHLAGRACGVRVPGFAWLRPPARPLISRLFPPPKRAGRACRARHAESIRNPARVELRAHAGLRSGR